MGQDERSSGKEQQEVTELKKEQPPGTEKESLEGEGSLLEDLEEVDELEETGIHIEEPVSEEDQELDELVEAQKEAEAYKDRWVRLVAEFENYKKRMAKEFSALIKSASEDLIRDLLPILDAVDRALYHRGDGQTDSEEFRQGIKMIMEELPRTLQGRNLSEIDAEGKKFDPNFHEALMQVDSADYDAEMVAEVIEKGYRLGDKVIRPAKVTVSRGEISKETEKVGDEEEG